MEESGKVAADATRKRKYTVQELLRSGAKDGDVVDIEDSVYRVFNKLRFERGGVARSSRIVVFGSEGGSVSASFWDKGADIVDSVMLQRKDRAIATNMTVRGAGGELALHSTNSTYVSRLMPARSAVTDLSQLRGGEKNVDVSGRVLAVGQIRYFKNLSGRDSGVSDCTMTDGKVEARIVLWGSSSACAGEMHPGDYIKAEFVSVKGTDNGIEITANDSARVLLNRRQI